MSYMGFWIGWRRFDLAGFEIFALNPFLGGGDGPGGVAVAGWFDFADDDARFAFGGGFVGPLWSGLPGIGGPSPVSRAG